MGKWGEKICSKLCGEGARAAVFQRWWRRLLPPNRRRTGATRSPAPDSFVRARRDPPTLSSILDMAAFRSLSRATVAALVASLVLPLACVAELESEPAPTMVPPGKFCGTYELFGFVHLLIEVSERALHHLSLSTTADLSLVSERGRERWRPPRRHRCAESGPLRVRGVKDGLGLPSLSARARAPREPD